MSFIRPVTAVAGNQVFPLSISSNGRFLQQANGAAFFINGDTPWSITTELNSTQLTTYMNDRQSKGFTALMFEAMNVRFSNNSPTYLNTNGDKPFTTTSFTSATFESQVAAYWTNVDSIVNAALARNMLCIMHPCYLGFGGGSGTSGDQGWDFQQMAATTAHLQSFGQFLASRYTQGNVIWCMGGDYGDNLHLTQQWNIAIGIQSVTPNAIFTGHGGRTDTGYGDWNGMTGFSTTKWLNSLYTDFNGGTGTPEYTYAANAYNTANTGGVARPFVLLEAYYDGELGSAADCRRQAYSTVLGGGCGHFFGNNPIWSFGDPNGDSNVGVATALGSLTTTATTQMTYVGALFTAYHWEKLVPKTDTTLVTTALGSGTSRIFPSLASDGTLAMVWNPSATAATVNMAAMTGVSSVRARFYDTTAGTYSNVTGNPFTPSGTQSITWPGEAILVLDQA